MYTKKKKECYRCLLRTERDRGKKNNGLHNIAQHESLVCAHINMQMGAHNDSFLHHFVTFRLLACCAVYTLGLNGSGWIRIYDQFCEICDNDLC